jgi:hypothetical protein
LVYFFPFWYFVSKKNLATLLQMAAGAEVTEIFQLRIKVVYCSWQAFQILWQPFTISAAPSGGGYQGPIM